MAQLQGVRRSVAGFRPEADNQHILAGRDVPADRQLPLRRNRDTVYPSKFFLFRTGLKALSRRSNRRNQPRPHCYRENAI
jgi:hypothetical protein